MFKNFAIILCVLAALCFVTDGHAKTKKNKSKKGARVSRVYKKSKHKRNSRRAHHGNGPDLKAITTESTYKEDPNNGVNSIETKQGI